MHELTKQSTDWVLSQAAQARPTSWAQFESDLKARSEIPLAPSSPLVDRLDAIEQQVAQQIKAEREQERQASKTRLRLGKGAQAEPFKSLITRAYYVALDYGCPRQEMPGFDVIAEPFAGDPATCAAKHHSEIEKGAVVGVVWINPKNDLWKDAKGYMATQGDQFSTSSDLHAVVHEIGHHYHRVVSLAQDIGRPFEPHPRFAEIARTVSKRATVGSVEFVAECFVAHVMGRALSADAEQMYDYYKGWRPGTRITKGDQAAPTIHVHVPAAQAPVIHVQVPPQAPPVVTVHPEIKMPATTTSVRVLRDRNTGKMTGAESETRPQE